MMLNMMNFFISCLMVSFFYKHILLTLISLEFLMMNLFMNMYNIFNLMNFNYFFFNLFLTISICEGIMGLTILVYMIRNSGNDFSILLKLIKW
uniref:NADH dehydrogenase subunit 4L n=1 Tax=Euurobracon yokahamae TaxID=2911681 RepID=UPI00207AF745|nr:NADH dehydrogenase subunit 4L [Euurobracon yokahamae]UJJ81892.1 NADH dehydrogenase subunit 4L [Euurobracon yokahamae]